MSHAPIPCAACGTVYTPRRPNYRASQRCCSPRCAATLGGAAQHRLHSMAGPNNPNFKGWASRRPIVYVRRFRASHPEQVAVQRVIAAAFRKGLLVRPSTCEDCGTVCKPDAHHDDYTRPLDVVWVCRRCHVQRDRIRQLREADRRPLSPYLTNEEAARYLRFTSIVSFQQWAKRQSLRPNTGGHALLWDKQYLDNAITTKAYPAKRGAR